MRHLMAAFCAFALLAGLGLRPDLALAQSGTPAQALTSCGSPVNSPVNGSYYSLTTDLTGRLCGSFTSPSGTSANQVQGTSAAAATDDGSNPVKLGGVYNSSLPTYTNGQRTNVQTNTHGNLAVMPVDTNGLFYGSVSTFGDGSSNSASGVNSMGVWDHPYLFNGSTWDRQFTCPNTVAVNVTAGSTTQIVALSGTTVIRVCSMSLSMSAAGTAGVYTGTGTNCGTGTTALVQDMTLATGTPLSLSAPSGSSLVRSSAGGELCVKAVTGNVTGFVSYVQF